MASHRRRRTGIFQHRICSYPVSFTSSCTAVLLVDLLDKRWRIEECHTPNKFILDNVGFHLTSGAIQFYSTSLDANRTGFSYADAECPQHARLSWTSNWMPNGFRGTARDTVRNGNVLIFFELLLTLSFSLSLSLSLCISFSVDRSSFVLFCTQAHFNRYQLRPILSDCPSYEPGPSRTSRLVINLSR